MKIKTKNRITRSKVVVFLILLSVSSIAIALFLLSQKSEKENTTDTAVPKPSSSDQQQADNLASAPENKNSSVNTDAPSSIVSNDQNKKSIVQMSSYASVTDDTLYIRGGVNNAVVYDGDCYSQLNGPRGESIRKNTTLLQNPSTTDCKTIAISTNELSKGLWSAKLHYTSNDLEGVSNEVSFEIK